MIDEEEDEDGTLYRDLFSGKTNKVTIGVVPCSTSLWRSDQWDPIFGKDFFDKLPGTGVYEITHAEFVGICEGISKEKICTHKDKDMCEKYGWHPTPEQVAKFCDISGTGSRSFRMSVTFSEFIGRAKPIYDLDDIVE